MAKVCRLLAVVVLVLSPAWVTAPAAATFTVNTTIDEPDAHPGDGSCSSTPSALCTVRAAVEETNVLAGADSVVVPAGIYVLGLGSLAIRDDLTLGGAGVDATVLDGAGAEVLFAMPVANFALSRNTHSSIADMTIRNGSPRGIIVERATFQPLPMVFEVFFAVVTLTRVSVSGHQGTGIDNSGVLTIVDSTVSANAGPGILNAEQLVMVGSTVSGNAGTGIVSNGTPPRPAVATLTNVTISGNSSTGSGGGLFVGALAEGSLGYVTVVGNTADGDGDASGQGGGIFVAGTLSVANSLIAGNQRGGSAPVADDCAGPLTSGGHNLIQVTTGCTIAGDLTGNLTGVDPQVGSLGPNGGPTRTHALLAGSPAIDAADPTECQITDQRGVPRPRDGDNDGTARCDIGAYEFIFVSASVAVMLNQTSFRADDPLRVSLEVANPGPATPVDVYFGFVLPIAVNGALGCTNPADIAVAFLASGFGRIELRCVSSGPAAYPKLFAGLLIPASLPPTNLGTVFATTLPPGLPTGPWVVFVVLTPPNALADNSIDLPPDFLTAATAGFLVRP